MPEFVEKEEKRCSDHYLVSFLFGFTHFYRPVVEKLHKFVAHSNRFFARMIPRIRLPAILESYFDIGRQSESFIETVGDVVNYFLILKSLIKFSVFLVLNCRIDGNKITLVRVFARRA